jgi:hypothetical protein
MRTIRLVIAAIIFSLGLSSCTIDEEVPIVEENPMADFKMVSSVKANTHTIEVYSEQRQYTIGYNELFIRIKEDASDSYISNAEISWIPMMHMEHMQHSCPKSAIVADGDESVYRGYVIFQMPRNAEEYWDLTLDYTIDGIVYSATQRLDVKAPTDDKRRVTVFTGNDDIRYVLAMMPLEPEVAINDFSAKLFKMESMMTFSIVENYVIALDPRMPGMGNHSSPNNGNLVYDVESKTYKGKLSFTMTGYWKINMKLLNESDEIIKGEDVTDEIPESSLFFELEF